MKIARSAAACAFTILLCSCTGTTLKSTWKAPAYQGPPFRDVAALAMDDRGLLRQGFENRFVNQIKGSGGTAITTYDLLNLKEIANDKPAAAARLRDAGADCVLILRLIDSAISYREVRAGGERYAGVTTGWDSTVWGDYYTVAFADMGTTYGSMKQHVWLETALFDLKTGKRVWSGVTQTVTKEGQDRLPEMDKIVSKVLAAMRKDSMIQ